MYNHKYNMSVDYCKFLAKKMAVEYIYNAAHLEGVPVTFPKTAAILDGAETTGLTITDVSLIINLKTAWKELLTLLTESMSYALICYFHSLISVNLVNFCKPGVPRTFPVRISGTIYQPPIPDIPTVREKLLEILKIPGAIDRAFELCSYLMRTQLFEDCNKRASLLCVNQILIGTDNGVLTIPPEHKEEFEKLLVQFYESNDATKLHQFWFDKCLIGVMQQEHSPTSMF